MVSLTLNWKSFSTEKKPESKKKQESDASDGISDLLAQMTLQSSSYSRAEPQPLQPTSSSTPDVVILDTPLSQKQQKHRKDMTDCPTTSLPHAESEASPSVSAVIDALHLSDIDWDTLSFTSSPIHSTQAKLNETPDSDVKETASKNTEQKTSSEAKQANLRSAPQLCHIECPLRDRVLMKNTGKTVNTGVYNVTSKQLNYYSFSLEHNSTSSGQMPCKGSSDSNVSGEKSAVDKKEPLIAKDQSVTGNLDTQNSNKQTISAVQGQCKVKKSNGSKKPAQKYTFVRSAVSSLPVPPQRCHSDPAQRDKDMSVPQTTKKSVCMSVCSSSEDSDVENHQSGTHRITKLQPVNKMKSNLISDLSLKPVSTKAAAKPAKLREARAQSHRAEDKVNMHVSTTNKCQDVPPADVDGDVFLQTPASPVIELHSDDSVICSESPLPLAERLRLKFMKWAVWLQDVNM